VRSGQCAVGSAQWAVRSGQWAVGSGQRAEGRGQRAVGRGQWAEIAGAISFLSNIHCPLSTLQHSRLRRAVTDATTGRNCQSSVAVTSDRFFCCPFWLNVTRHSDRRVASTSCCSQHTRGNPRGGRLVRCARSPAPTGLFLFLDLFFPVLCSGRPALSRGVSGLDSLRPLNRLVRSAEIFFAERVARSGDRPQHASGSVRKQHTTTQSRAMV
jgi:hypothetical protein